MEILLERVWHKEFECLAIKFKYDVAIFNALRKIEGGRWSKTYCAWLLNFSQQQVNEVCKLLNDGNNILFKNDLKEIELSKTLKEKSPVNTLAGLNDEAQKKVKAFENWMHSKRYSNNTVGTYSDALKAFLRFYAYKPVSEIQIMM